MKFITKKQTAQVVNRMGDKPGLDLQVLLPGTEVDGKIVPEEEITKEEPLVSESAMGESAADYNRWVNECMNENQKFKKIALAGQQVGDTVTVLLKYLVE